MNRFAMLMTLAACSVDGIYPAPTGTAVYIAGESCTINYGENFETDVEWCLDQHRMFAQRVSDDGWGYSYLPQYACVVDANTSFQDFEEALDWCLLKYEQDYDLNENL